MKSVEEIYREMLDCFAQRTGMRPAEGCDLAARLYAVAAQVYSLYVQAEWLGRQVLPQTAEGEFLDRHAQLRGIARKEAAPAEGVIRFAAGETADTARVIPVGTVCMTAGRVRFETTEEGAPDEGLLAQLNDYFQARREIAVEVQVKAPTLAAVAVYVQIKPAEGYTFAQAAETVKARLQAWFTGERLGQGVLRSQLADLMYHCEGVANYNIVSPRKDVAGSPEVLPQLGRVTTEEMK